MNIKMAEVKDEKGLERYLTTWNIKMAEVKDENGRKERFYLFYDGESVTGKVNITLHR